MRKLGRCGRQRRIRHSEFKGISQTHLPEYIRLQQWMQKWMKNKNCRSRLKPGLEPADFKDTGRGLQAGKKISPGEVIISIPAQFLITADTVFASDIGHIILQEEQHFTPLQLLTIFLVIEKQHGDSSPWFPYLNTLPDVYSLCIYFSPSEIDLLTPRAKILAKSLRERYDKGVKNIQEFIMQSAPMYKDAFSDPAVKWAWSTVNTRSVYLETPLHPLLVADQEESNGALAPFLDLLNHKDSAQISAGLNRSSNCYEIVTQDTYKKNEQVFICYGAHDNAKLAVEYGFTLSKNLHNCYFFKVDDLLSLLQTNAQHVERKKAIITEAQLNKHFVCNVDGLSWCTVTALRIAALSWDQLSAWQWHIQDANLSAEVGDTAHKLTEQLVRSALLKAKKHLQLVEQQPQLTHYDQLRSLAADDVHILEISLAFLKNRCQVSD